MQRLPFISSEYVYNTYSKFRSWLTDDIIYSNLINMLKLDDRISYPKQKVSKYLLTVYYVLYIYLIHVQCK